MSDAEEAALDDVMECRAITGYDTVVLERVLTELVWFEALVRGCIVRGEMRVEAAISRIIVEISPMLFE